jgi:hypothetical protein
MKGALVVSVPATATGHTVALKPHLTSSQSAALFRRFLADTIETTRDIEGVDFFVAGPPGGGRHFLKGTVPPLFQCIPRSSPDTPGHLSAIFRDLFARGYEYVVLLGGASPDLPTCLLQQGTELLAGAKADFVIGPSERGGFYLLGLGRECPALLDRVDWDSPQADRHALQRARSLGLRSCRLPEWYDIIDLDDLRRHLTYYGLRQDAATGHISQTGRYLLKIQDRIFSPVC